jgi:Alw26I/Eco31I/Esp3I family type II restriction m6 adenine DNA methyltransferase
MTTALAKDIPVEKTDFGPGKTPLYYNNVGLFSDPFLEDRLPNLEKYYNHNSTKYLNNYWNIDEFDSHKFNKAYQDIMDLWCSLDKDVPKYCDKERQLQNRWIDKIFEALGWTIELEETVSRHGKNNFPDYGLYKNFDDWKKSRELSGNKKFKRTVAVADAKDWGVNLDGKGFSNKNPSFQIINYLKQTDKTWGILTDGRYWRIYSVRSDSKHTTYFEIDLIKILASGDYERFKYFYNFFRVEAFVPEATLSDRCFLDFVFEDGQFYSQRVEKNLQERVYRVVDTICKGFLENYKEPSSEDLEEVYEYSMYYLFKLMFVLNCESKGLLEVNKQDDYYEFSLRRKCLEIKEQFEEGKNWSYIPRSYNYIMDLFELLKYGDEKIGVHGFGNEVFEAGSDEYYHKFKLSDAHLNHALLELSCDYDEDDNFQFIDYKILSPDHIGSMFEGLLEYSLQIADQDYAVEKNKFITWESLHQSKKIKLKDTKINTGDPYLTNTNRERKNTGSYYTPDFLVNYVTSLPLRKMCKNLSVAQILELNICDPSMGSAHFLLGVIRILEEIVLEKMEDMDSSTDLTADEVRKELLHSCVYGVDINPLAVELSKFSLWIFSAKKADTLEPLEDQIKFGNSLVDDLAGYDLNFKWEEEFSFFKENNGFDLVVGNPPWDKLKATDLDFFRYFSQDYIMQTKSDKDQLKENLLADPEVMAEYKKYKHDKEIMIDYLKNCEKYQSQVISIDGKKISGDTNLYKYFFECFFNITKPNGVFGVIMPHSFISDTGASGLRRLLLEQSELDVAISFQNETKKVKAFSGVASNVKICAVMAQKGKKTKVYRSKYLIDFEELDDERSLMRINQEKFGDVFGDYRNIICLEKPIDIKIHDKLNEFSVAKDNEYGISLVVKSGEADMTNKKKYFVTTRTKYPLITGREFSPFTGVKSPSKFVMTEFASTVERAKKSRVVIKAIMPDSIKKVQATILPKNSILSNNLFSVGCGCGSEDENKALIAVLNSDLMEYRIRCFLSNFRLTHRNLYQIPIDREMFKKLTSVSSIKIIDNLLENPESLSDLKKLNEMIYKVFGIDNFEKNRIHEYIYGVLDEASIEIEKAEAA